MKIIDTEGLAPCEFGETILELITIEPNHKMIVLYKECYECKFKHVAYQREALASNMKWLREFKKIPGVVYIERESELWKKN